MSLSVLDTLKTSIRFSALVGAMFPLATPLMAQTVQEASVSDGQTDETPKKDLEITLGAGVGIAPDYFGSKKTEADFVPIIDIVWKNRFFLSTLQGLGVYAVNNEDTGLTLGASVAPGNP